MTFLQFQKELYYISEGFIHKNSQKDLRRCEGFQKVLYSALSRRLFKIQPAIELAKIQNKWRESQKTLIKCLN